MAKITPSDEILHEFNKFVENNPNAEKFTTVNEDGHEIICYIHSGKATHWDLGRRHFQSDKPIVLVDMDRVLVDFDKGFYPYLERFPNRGLPHENKDFFLDLDPLEGAIEAYKLLGTKFVTKIVTAPAIKNLWCYTEKAAWVEKHLGKDTLYDLTLTKDKHLVQGDYLIDDTLYKGFKGTQLLFGSDDFPDWFNVLKHFNLR